MMDNGTQATMWSVRAGCIWVTSWKLKLRWWHYIEWPETQNLNYYKWIPSLSGKKNKAPCDLNRNLKKIKSERPWNEEKKRKINRKESCEIKGLDLQFNTEKSMQGWIPSDLAQIWRSRRKKQIMLSENWEAAFLSVFLTPNWLPLLSLLGRQVTLLTKFIYLLIFWLHHAVCGILVPQPGTELRPTAVKAPSLNHWTTREFPLYPNLNTSGFSTFDSGSSTVFSPYLLPRLKNS